MAAAGTKQIPLGFTAPDFTLPDTVSGRNKSLQELKGKVATVVMFTCNHCPYVINVNAQLVSLANEYIPQGIGFIAISSNDVSRYPQDSPELMTKLAKDAGYPFPYLYDESQQVAKAYDAVCTPDFSIFDKDLKCVYRGQLDDSRPNSGIVSDGKDIRAVLSALIEGDVVGEDQLPSIGCSIKWKI